MLSVTSIFAEGNQAQGPLPRACQAHLDLVRENAAMISWVSAAETDKHSLFLSCTEKAPAAVRLGLCWWLGGDTGLQAPLKSERDLLVLLQ